MLIHIKCLNRKDFYKNHCSGAVPKFIGLLWKAEAFFQFEQFVGYTTIKSTLLAIMWNIFLKWTLIETNDKAYKWGNRWYDSIVNSYSFIFFLKFSYICKFKLNLFAKKASYTRTCLERKQSTDKVFLYLKTIFSKNCKY